MPYGGIDRKRSSKGDDEMQSRYDEMYGEIGLCFVLVELSTIIRM